MAEYKVIDSGQTGLGTPSAAGVLNLLNGVATGTDYNGRIGREVFNTELELRMFFEPNTAGNSVTGDVIRVIVVYDNQPNGAAPGVTDILQNNNYTEPYQINSRERIEVLADEYVELAANTYTAGSLATGDPCMKVLDISVPLNCTTTYSGTGATISSISSGSLYLFVISAYASWKATYNARVIFFDT